MATDSQNSDDSGKVYDFKDSKTSGVVTVTKTWDDSSSNDERPVPDVSISTEKPSKNPLGYTITYHGNGLAFADGTTENQIIVNSSGKIISGQYKELLTSSGWYSDSNCTTKIETDSNGLPVDGLVSDMDLYAKTKTFVLKKGSDFNKLISSTATSVIFTDETMPTSAALIDADADGDEGVVAWMDGTVMKVSTQTPGRQVIADTDCQKMFASKSNLISIDFNNLNTSNVTDMRYMLYNCSGLTNLDLTHLDTSKVTDMSFMFGYCSGLTNLDLASLDTSKVTDMSYMLCNCSGLTNLDLTPLDTSNVTNMRSMFDGCSGLTNLDLTPMNTQNVTNMSFMFSGCNGLANLDLTPMNTQNVTNMSFMFRYCSGLTNLDLTHLDTSNVIGMNSMFYNCTALSTLSLGEKFAFVGSNYYLPSGTWYASDGTAYTSNGITCTIPNNKSDTYTRQ